MADISNNTLFYTSLQFLFSLVLNIAVNSFLFSDATIEKKAKSEVGIDFITAWVLSLISNIFGSIVVSITCGLTDYIDLLLVIMVESQYSDHAKTLLRKYVKQIKSNLRKFFIIELILMIICIYYITIFCAIYTNTQIHVIKDTAISFGINMVTPIFINLIPGMFRIPSLRIKKTRKEKLYNFSKFLQKF